MIHPDPLPAPSPSVLPPIPAPSLDDIAAQAAAYGRATRAPSTQVAYARDWVAFETWCRRAGLPALPAAPATVGLYLTDLAARLAVATLGRRLAAIIVAHRLAGQPFESGHPAIRDVLRGIRRSRGTAQRRVAPATTAIARAMAASCGETPLGWRDRALILVGFAAALRRSELVALQVADVAIAPEGARLTLRRSKTDQEGAGEVVGVVRTGTSTCPVLALQAWLEASEIAAGPVFRSVDRHGRVGAQLTDQSVALIIKRRAALVGLDPALFSGHSLRAGLATSAAGHDVEERIIMRQTRHRSVTTLRRYIRDGELFTANASGRVGL